MNKVSISIIAFLLIYGYGYCQYDDTLQFRATNNTIKNLKMNRQELTDSNKAFLAMLVSNRRPLTEFPERVSEAFVVHLPSVLPFGGKYNGLDEYYALVPQMIAYYDYSKFELQGIFADENTVFVIIKVGLKSSDKHILLCEQFTFEEEKITEIRTYVLNY